MSYTLTGRIHSRLASAVPALLVALALQRWWAIELVGVMLALGLALDLVYDRLLDYQPGWLALPLGALELGLVYGGVRAFGIMAPLAWALALFAVAWASAQVLGQAFFPLLRLEYAEGGGELGRPGAATAAAVALVVVGGLGAAYAVKPPTIHLHGVVQGPLVIRHAQTLVGGTVRGGILVRASHVTLKDVTVVGGENGIDIEGASDVMLDGVHVVGPTLDGIHVRRGSVMVKDCSISAPRGPWVQGIDISFAMDKEMSMVEGCTIVGVREGIVTHWVMADLRDNTVTDTTLRGIDMGEMSMGTIAHNHVSNVKGVGILCLDHSECDIHGNHVARSQVPIMALYYARAKLRDNHAAEALAVDGSTIER
jgi:Right handed beta helix region